MRRGGRVVEGGGLLNRYTVTSRIEGSNPSPSATLRLRLRVAGHPLWTDTRRRLGVGVSPEARSRA